LASQGFAAVILLTAAGIASPLFVIVLAIIFILRLMWDFATGRLHDRDKSAWWLIACYVVPACLATLRIPRGLREE
jgi:uncharacterized membrane protein YhaH (DUF805 family)